MFNQKIEVMDALYTRFNMYEDIAESEGFKITWRDRLTGFYLFILMLPMLFKGMYWAYKEGLIKFKFQKKFQKQFDK